MLCATDILYCRSDVVTLRPIKEGIIITNFTLQTLSVVCTNNKGTYLNNKFALLISMRNEYIKYQY